MALPWNDLEHQIETAMLADRRRFGQWLRSVRRSQRKEGADTGLLQRLQQQLADSCARRQDRADRRPGWSWHDDLPITAHRHEIARAITEHPVVIVCGATGSGKSTQLPKICLELGRGIAGFIGHTQPRRIAARSIAARLASELSSPIGEHVGFKIRFQDTISASCSVKLMTDGILLAETERDRHLEQYDTILVDEAHERSLNIDFLLGYLHRLLPKRPDLRVIITSATLDAERFAAHFARGGMAAPILNVSGRGYPVETRYRPAALAADEDGDRRESDDVAPQAIAAALEELWQAGPGDVLVFLPSERAIRETARHLRGWSLHRRAACDILPLYARLSTAEQNRAFTRGAQQRVVLATNVAESSVTVPGIRYVIDTGTARISRYAPRIQVQRLPIEPISRAAADQRQGRCGREAPGICIRLYDEADYLARDPFGTPEIRRTNLAAVILRMLALRLGDLSDFPLLDPPRPEAIRDGLRTLFELEAIDDVGQLTELGRDMSRLPVDPRIARIILAGHEGQCLHAILILAAALEVQDPRLRPPAKEMLADQHHARFQHEQSDFMGYLALWDHFHQLKSNLSRSQLKQALAQQFLSYPRMTEWLDVFLQLRSMVAERGWRLQARADNYEAIHRAVATGLLTYVAHRRQRNAYEVAGGGTAYLWPGAGPFTTRPAWVLAAEMLETSRRYLRCAAQVDPEWIEQGAGHLIEREYSDPRWSRKLGTVTAMERVTLRGLPLRARRASDYGRVDPGTARHLFIQRALVEGSFRADFAFFIQNRALVQSLAALAARGRSPALLVPNATQYAFYDERLPDDVYDTKSLHRWLKRNRHASQQLTMQRSDLVADASMEPADVSAFPSHLQTGTQRLQLHYRFDPQLDDDGLSVTVSRTALAPLDDQRLDWLVPGLLIEKIVAMIRILPKSLRRNLIPAPDVARQAAGRLEFGRGPFVPTVAAVLASLADEPIRPDDFDLARLPRHLRLHLRVVDDQGRLLAQGRSAEDLRRQLDISAQETQHFSGSADWHRDALTTWDFDALPDEIVMTQPGGSTQGFPALVDQGQAAGLRVFQQPGMAQYEHRAGVRRLCILAARDSLRAHVAWLPALAAYEQQYAQIHPDEDLRGTLEELLAEMAFLSGAKVPRTRDAFAQLLRTGRDRIAEAVQDIATVVPEIITGCDQVHGALDNLPSRWDMARDESTRHLNRLLIPRFFVETPPDRLRHFPRYLRGVVMRADRLRGGGGQRDRELSELWWTWMDRYVDRQQQHAQRGVRDPELVEYRWMLEEFRVSLFAQELGTAMKVSPQRLEKQWARVAY